MGGTAANREGINSQDQAAAGIMGYLADEMKKSIGKNVPGGPAKQATGALPVFQQHLTNDHHIHTLSAR